MSTLHKDLAEANLHENKGVSTATDNTVATASSNATVWVKVNANMIDTTSIFNINKKLFQATIADVSTAETVMVVFPFACTVNKVTTVLEGTLTGADATVTCSNHSGGSMGTITVAYSGSAAKDVDSLSPSANNTFAANEVMSIATDGASTGTKRLWITIEVTRTA